MFHINLRFRGKFGQVPAKIKYLWLTPNWKRFDFWVWPFLFISCVMVTIYLNLVSLYYGGDMDKTLKDVEL